LKNILVRFKKKILNCENGLLGIGVDIVDNLEYAKLGEALLNFL
jgi:hypothetical protein